MVLLFPPTWVESVKQEHIHSLFMFDLNSLFISFLLTFFFHISCSLFCILVLYFFTSIFPSPLDFINCREKGEELYQELNVIQNKYTEKSGRTLYTKVKNTFKTIQTDVLGTTITYDYNISALWSCH